MKVENVLLGWISVIDLNRWSHHSKTVFLISNKILFFQSGSRQSPTRTWTRNTCPWSYSSWPCPDLIKLPDGFIAIKLFLLCNWCPRKWDCWILQSLSVSSLICGQSWSPPFDLSPVTGYSLLRVVCFKIFFNKKQKIGKFIYTTLP